MNTDKNRNDGGEYEGSDTLNSTNEALNTLANIEDTRNNTAKSIQHYTRIDRDESLDQLPILGYREEIEEMILNNDSCIIIGETGSGKTTQLPKITQDILPEGSKILISQPRRIATSSVSRYVASQMGSALGKKVGYQVRFDDMTSTGTNINFATDGIILSKLQADPLLREYDCIIVDEAHERSLNIDFLLGLLKNAQSLRKEQGLPQLKVIVTSATIEKEKFMQYFGDAPSLEVPGRLYPVDIEYLEEDPRDVCYSAAKTVQHIFDTKNDQGDILIFMPGQKEIDQTIRHIDDLQLEGVDVMPLHGSLDPTQQSKIFKRSDSRKIIVSTNIAETSLTLPGVTSVIDSGLIKQTNYNPHSKITELKNTNHSKAGCTQRTGRAGRVGPGSCFRLYSERNFETRELFGKPEILRSDLGSIILKMKDMKIDINSFSFIDRPHENQFLEAITTLKNLSALDENGTITNLGKLMVKIPLEAHLARMLIESGKHGATNEVSTIMAFLGIRNVFVRPKGKEQEADLAHRRFKNSESDFITLLNVWDQYQSNKGKKKWCKENYLNYRVLKEAQEIRLQLLSILRKIGIYPSSGKSNIADIKRSVTAGLIDQVIINNASDYSNNPQYSYSKCTSGGESIYIHPSSGVFEKKPQLLVAAELMTTSKTFARVCQGISVDDLKDFAPELVSKPSYGEYSYKPESGKVIRNVHHRVAGKTIKNTEEADRENTIQTILGFIYANISLMNDELNANLQKIRNLYIKSNLDERLFMSKEVFIEKMYGKITKECASGDIIGRIKSGELSISIHDLGISEDEIKNIEMESPEEIVIKGQKYTIKYSHHWNGTATAEIQVGEEFLSISQQQIPLLRKGIIINFKYNNKSFSDLTEVQNKIKEDGKESSLNDYNRAHRKPPEKSKIKQIPSIESLEALLGKYN